MRRNQPDYNPNVPVSASEGILVVGITLLIAGAGWLGKSLAIRKKRADDRYCQEMEKYRNNRNKPRGHAHSRDNRK